MGSGGRRRWLKLRLKKGTEYQYKHRAYQRISKYKLNINTLEEKLVLELGYSERQVKDLIRGGKVYLNNKKIKTGKKKLRNLDIIKVLTTYYKKDRASILKNKQLLDGTNSLELTKLQDKERRKIPRFMEYEIYLRKGYKKV
jgi:hypothetical protein